MFYIEPQAFWKFWRLLLLLRLYACLLHEVREKVTGQKTGENASYCNYDDELQLSEHEIASLYSTITEVIACRDNIDLISDFMSDLGKLNVSMNDEILTLMNAIKQNRYY